MSSILDDAPASFYAIIILMFSLVFWTVSGVRLPEPIEVMIGLGFTIMFIVLLLKLNYDQDNKKEDTQ